MTGARKKIRLSILNRIAILFLLALTLSAGVTIILSQNYMMDNAAKEGEEIARGVATAAQVAIGSRENIEKLMTDAGYREKIHQTFRFICGRSGVRYLYLYTIDEQEHRHYIICAANTDEDDEAVRKTVVFGAVTTSALYTAERAVLNGDSDGEYAFMDNDYGNVCSFFLPVIVDSELLALIGVDYSFESILNIERQNLRTLSILGVTIIGSAFMLALLLIRQLVIGPILLLSGRMKSYVDDKKRDIETEHRTSAFEDEITDIEGSFDKMVGDISQYIEDIEHLAAEKAQNQTQLDVARSIQSGIVPEEYSLFGNGYEVYGVERPARDVGGDFYDIFLLDEDRICVVVGDISGKGIYAAMFMVMVKTAIRDKLRTGCSLDDTLNEVNHDICIRNPENMFATIFAMILDTKTGVLRYANAGHEPPLLLGSETDYLEMEHGIALGVFEDSGIVSEELKLNDGDGILIYTDGITEAIDPAKIQYGRDRLRKAVHDIYSADDDSCSPGRLVTSVVGSVKAFGGEREQFDDITCAAVIYRENLKKGLTPDIGSFKAVKDTILSSLGDREETRRMILACEEIFSNIVDHSGADQVLFSCERAGRDYSVTFSDNGVPFDPLRAAIRDREFEDLDQGGMGIRLARMYSREMDYLRDRDRNILTLSFEISDQAAKNTENRI